MANEPHVLSTTEGDLPLETYHLRLGERAWTILHAGAILSIDDEQRLLGSELARFPYGIVLWPSSIALAPGLPGLIAASLGARVVQTERQEVALHMCRRNAQENSSAH